MHNPFSYLKDQRGMSFILVCLGITALFGMSALVTDFGRIALARQRLVNAVDSGALAGARDLIFVSDPLTRDMTARQTAVDVAVANGAPADGITVNIENNEVSVDVQQDVSLIMSRVFGVEKKTVSAHAAAEAGSIKSYLGIAPLTIKEQPFVYGQLYTLKYGSPTSPGNFGALSLGGDGANTYRDNLINGYQSVIKVGDTLPTKPGNMSGPTDGIDQRLALCTDGCTYDNFLPGCPRVIIIPTNNDENLNGRDEITVTGFAAFFVDRTDCASDEIKGYFVHMPAEGSPDFDNPVVGLYGAKLIE